MTDTRIKTVQYGSAVPWIVDHDPLPVGRWDEPGTGGDLVTSTFVERYWVPIIGPTALMVARQLIYLSNATIPLGELGHRVGVSKHGTAKNSPIVRTLSRLVDFQFARIEDDQYQARLHVPDPPAHLARRHLPEAFQDELEQMGRLPPRRR